MQKLSILYQKGPSNLGKNMYGQLDSRFFAVVPKLMLDKSVIKSCGLKARFPHIIGIAGQDFMKRSRIFQNFQVKGMASENLEELSDEDEELCPVDCVREIKTDEELLRILEKAKDSNSLVVVDFYRTSCGSCKYIEQGFAKLCKRSGDKEAAVIFLKHNVIDEYDEQSEIADRLRIKTVPLFHFYKGGDLLEAFPTRDKERIDAAILKYTNLASSDL
ncbi:unnamed protein product [Ilex paraguariensis]|uniref:Thioredoxin domain-containing protein n=1 Tax=Ilex paraguariensis TaxID=185542 RepID=A0ABC8UBP5_9AQUA